MALGMRCPRAPGRGPWVSLAPPGGRPWALTGHSGHSQAHAHHVAVLRRRGSEDDFNAVQKGSILPASALPGLDRREAEKQVAPGGCPFRGRQERGCGPRGLVLWSLGSWLGEDQPLVERLGPLQLVQPGTTLVQPGRG